MNPVLQFLWNFKFIILFYLLLGGFFYIKRKQVVSQGKVIFLLRTPWGIKLMQRWAKKYREWIILLGYIGTGVGFIGMVLIVVLLFKNIIDLFLVPQAAAGVSLVLPGVNVPGLGVLPFWYWLVGIFLIALVHEFGHGIVAKAHNIRIKHTGLALFGPIIGAFVEPDEEKLSQHSDIAQYSVLAAGAFANVILGLLALVLFAFVFTPLQAGMTQADGFSFSSYTSEDMPAALIGLPAQTTITHIDGKRITSFQEFAVDYSTKKPGDQIVLQANKQNYTFALAANQQGNAFMGIEFIQNEVVLKQEFETGFNYVKYAVVSWVTGFLRWLYVLSLGIGLFNLVPLPIVDGGRMVQVFLRKLKGQERGDKWYAKIGFFFLVILGILFLFSIGQSFF